MKRRVLLVKSQSAELPDFRVNLRSSQHFSGENTRTPSISLTLNAFDS